MTESLGNQREIFQTLEILDTWAMSGIMGNKDIDKNTVDKNDDKYDDNQNEDDTDKIIVVAYAIRERLDEGDYYPEDGYKLGKCYTDNEKIDTKDNYDLEQSKKYLADYILKTLEILNTCTIAQGKKNKHERRKYVDRNNENYYERSKEMNEHKKEETSPAAAIEEL